MRPEQSRELLRSLGILDAAQPESDEERKFPSFDGGARTPAPLLSDPETDHGQTVVEIVQRWKSGQGGW